MAFEFVTSNVKMAIKAQTAPRLKLGYKTSLRCLYHIIRRIKDVLKTS